MVSILSSTSCCWLSVVYEWVGIGCCGGTGALSCGVGVGVGGCAFRFCRCFGTVAFCLGGAEDALEVASALCVVLVGRRMGIVHLDSPLRVSDHVIPGMYLRLCISCGVVYGMDLPSGP